MQVQLRACSEPAPTAPLTVELCAGCPDEVDRLCAEAAPEHHFLRAAWYAAAGAEQWLVARRGNAPIAIFPTNAAGPPALGARSVAGIYWPFRSPLLSAEADAAAVTELLAIIHRRNLLGPVWRMGPVYRDHPAARLLIHGAAAAGWTLLTRSLGRTYILDVDAARREAPCLARPRASGWTPIAVRWNGSARLRSTS